jgi:antitoxin component YwqK of YwqJK toxin-antitoxin module
VKIFNLLIFVLFYNDLSGQLFHHKINTNNSDGKKDGLWVTYYNGENKLVQSREHYKDGIETGVCKHYYSNGNIRLKWRYYKNLVKAKYYFENGNLEQKGWSRIEWTAADVHYYWHGQWKFFDEKRKLIRKAFYQYGEEITNLE